MDPALAVLIVLVVIVIAALAIYLIATILELRKITAGLDVVIGGVGEIVAKSSPVNGVVDAINSNLVIGRDLLENLLLQKAGQDSAGLVESLFPGEGANFLRRVGRSGKVVNVGTVYTRGVAILASLGRGAPIGAAHAKGPAVRDPQYSTTAAAMLYPAPADRRGTTSQHIGKSPVVGSGYGPLGGPAGYVPATTPGERPGRPRAEAPAPAAPGRIDVRAPAPPPPPPPPPPPAPPAPPAGDAGGEEVAPPPAGGALNIRGKRPWER